MSAWTHAICRDCWLSQHPDEPAHALTNHVSTETCCFCLASTADGIYVRQDPRTVACSGRGGPHGEESGWQPAKARVEPGVIEHGLSARSPTANWMFAAVRTFMVSAGSQTIGDPRAPATNDLELRVECVFEEAVEFVEACGFEIKGDETNGVVNAGLWSVRRIRPPNLIAAIDALCDLLYVVFGTFVSWGLNPAPFFKEVHDSNMTKVSPDKLVREDGRVMKGPSYRPPDLQRVLDDELRKVICTCGVPSQESAICPVHGERG